MKGTEEKEVKKTAETRNLKIATPEDRALLLICGICCFPLGFALYFYYKDRKDRSEFAKFARMGGYVGLFSTIAILSAALIVYMYYLFSLCF